METATAATSGAAGTRSRDRLRELAANLKLHRGFVEVVASLEAGHGASRCEHFLQNIQDTRCGFTIEPSQFLE
jgi:hypothetical protein